ncbi:hypothetical protein AB1Y20_011011 [Prymnesium parvum]|uniref:Uncharacterized protein n=1 Tax=Prymnesium parvum TaxID=97485 RepID=A0AB34ILP4_PRYPA
MESLAEAAEAAGATPEGREETALDGATDRDEACAIVGEKRVRSDAVTAMQNKMEHLRGRLAKKIDLIEKQRRRWRRARISRCRRVKPRPWTSGASTSTR